MMFIRKRSGHCASIIIVATLFISIASAAPNTGLNGMKETVVRYNQGLAAASRSGDVAMLEPLATEKIVAKTFSWIHSWQDSDLYMKAELTKLEFKDIRRDKNVSMVRTREEWNYTYFDAKTKKNAMPKTQALYEMKYSLFLHQGKWIISDTKIVSEKHTPLEKIRNNTHKF